MSRLLAMVIAMALVQTMDGYTTTERGYTFDAFQVIEAERYSYYYVAKYYTCPSTNVGYMGYIQSGAVLGYYGVNFGPGAEMVQLRIAAWDHGIINLYVDSTADEPIARIPIQKVDSSTNVCSFVVFQQFVSTVPTAIHNLYFTFDFPSGVQSFVNIDWFTFKTTT